MAEENEKKPGFVVHKKQQDAAPANASTEKKKVVVVKKKTPANPQTNTQPQKHVVVKKNETAAVVSHKNEEKAASAGKPEGTKARTFELNSARPNVKAGNLSDKPRQGGFNRGGQGGQGGGYRGGQGGPGGYNRDRNGQGGGFSGSQARQNYQNRDRDNNGQGGRPGFNRGGQGGFNRGGQGGQGGFRGGQGGQGGFRPRTGGMGGAAPVPPVDQSRQPAKKAFKGKKQIYNRKDEEQYDDNLFGQKKKVETPASVVPKSIDIMETISVSDLARKMNLKASEVIAKLMGMGMMVTITQSIDSDTATLLAAEYGCEVHLVSLYDETVIESEKDDGVELLPRPPIVTVMGHVDHGKTKTLDAIRHSHVAEGEAGGITQSIGAYSVSTPKGKITFLDTPGHEAFTMMRARGAQVTDIVVLVVAADDGVMPQTMEAIAHAKDAKVPIIVAVNKVDKPEANPDRVKTQLSEQGLTPEEWGGDTQYVHNSALKKEGIDDLLDAILLQAEMLELKANYECRAEGKILESRVDQGRGVVSTVVVQRGTLRQGDPFVAGIYSGRVRAMFDDRGRRITEAGPSTPVEVLGMEEMPNAGDPFQVTESEKDARAISAKRQELKRFEAAKAVKKTTLDTLFSDIKDSEVKELKVIIKADLQGSAEALKASLEKLSTREIRLSVIHSSAGAINESDVTLAAADSNAIIIGFNVRPTPKAKTLAEQEQVEIRKYNIIYKCVEEIQAAMEGMLQPDTKEEVIGQVEVRNTFKVPKVGVIAGCSVSEGIVRRSASVNLVRDGIVIFTGKISSLKRFKDDAKEVSVGYECGIGLENWQDIQVGDKLEVFEIIEVAKKLGKTIAEEEAEAAKRNVTSAGSEGAQ
ncbi:translation initiation factor IF-2 [Treponema bryantii]|uniref:translation initiation factor IF-2 n=1 Tax=Treponema bryantii TaxID=163 RepID=UPI0003B3688A|nr:translation initiation factor IF-2 [Treponema bryantii]